MFFDDPALQSLKSQFVKEKVRKEGQVKANERGFGFLESDRESIFIAPPDMRKVMHGDKVSAVIDDGDNGKPRATPEKLIEPFLSRFVARVLMVSGKLNVVPDHPDISMKIPAADARSDKEHKLANHDWVVCTLTKHALRDGAFLCDITEFYCGETCPTAPRIVTLRRYDLPLKELDDREFEFLEKDLPREDLTAVPYVTIDSDHTEDMDDALFIEKKDDGGFVLHTAIADPTGYISEDSEFNAEAAKRGFSIYLPGRDIPMLPRCLSDNICSLREGEVRPVLAGEIHILPDGAIDFEKTAFTLATIKSHGKLVYNLVSDYLEGKPDAQWKPTPEIEQVLNTLVEFTKLRDAYRSTHAAPFRNRSDYDFVLTEDGALDHIEVNNRRIANQLVEESMIASNVAAGELLAAKLGHGVFNTHLGFDLKYKKDLIALLERENCPFEADRLDTLEEYNKIRRHAFNTDNVYLDCRIRKLQQYSEMAVTPRPHFALGVTNYATWTSPIRKYGDMVNHRLLKSLAVSSAHPKMPDEKVLADMNLARRVNRFAERDVRDWLYVDYLEPEIEKQTVFDGEVFDITRAGLKILLLENGAMVFVPGSFISKEKDSFTLDGDSGEILVDGKSVLRLGDPFKVKIFEVDKKNRSVTAVPAVGLPGLMLPNPESLKHKQDLNKPARPEKDSRQGHDRGRQNHGRR